MKKTALIAAIALIAFGALAALVPAGLSLGRPWPSADRFWPLFWMGGWVLLEVGIVLSFRATASGGRRKILGMFLVLPGALFLTAFALTSANILGGHYNPRIVPSIAALGAVLLVNGIVVWILGRRTPWRKKTPAAPEGSKAGKRPAAPQGSKRQAQEVASTASPTDDPWNGRYEVYHLLCRWFLDERGALWIDLAETPEAEAQEAHAGSRGALPEASISALVSRLGHFPTAPDQVKSTQDSYRDALGGYVHAWLEYQKLHSPATKNSLANASVRESEALEKWVLSTSRQTEHA